MPTSALTRSSRTADLCAQVGGLFAGGVALFSGSCYAAALSGDRANGRLAPYGGGMLIAGWLALALA